MHGARNSIGEVDAVGSPSRWLRRRRAESSGPYRAANRGITFKINGLVQQLKDSGSASTSSATIHESRIEAVKALVELVASASGEGEEAAEAATAAAVTLLQTEKDKDVRSSLLTSLRRLAEDGQATSIGLQSHRVVSCLKDEDASIQRKACVLLRIVVEEGGAPLVARHVPALIDCFKASKLSLLAPLDTLTALAEAGEGQAVAQAVSTLVDALKDESSRVCIAACSALGTVVASGGGNLLRMCGQLEATSAPEPTDAGGTGTEASSTLLDLLVSLSLEAEDHECRLAAADSLRCMVEADPDIRAIVRDKHSFPLFIGIRKFFCDAEIRKTLMTVLDLSDAPIPAPAKKPSTAEGAVKEDDADGEEDADGEDCAICCSGMGKDQVETLPCGHYFHAECIGSWFNYQRKSNHAQTCPLCRWRKAGPQAKSRPGAPAQPRPPQVAAQPARATQRARAVQRTPPARAAHARSTARNSSPRAGSPTGRNTSSPRSIPRRPRSAPGR